MFSMDRSLGFQCFYTMILQFLYHCRTFSDINLLSVELLWMFIVWLYECVLIEKQQGEYWKKNNQVVLLKNIIYNPNINYVRVKKSLKEHLRIHNLTRVKKGFLTRIFDLFGLKGCYLNRISIDLLNRACSISIRCKKCSHVVLWWGGLFVGSMLVDRGN